MSTDTDTLPPEIQQLYGSISKKEIINFLKNNL